MNNKIFIAMPIRNEMRMDDIRVRLEGYHMFDRYGDAYLSDKYKHFGFSSVIPDMSGCRVRWFRRMLGCSYVYFPCGWQADKCSRKAFAWAELLGKKVIFEEDGRCR